MTITGERSTKLLKRYGIHPPVTDRRYLSHGQIDRGTLLSIVLMHDPRYGHKIVVACNRFESARPIPINLEEASNITDELIHLHLIPEREQERHMLDNLLLRCSDLYSQEQLEWLSLTPVYLRENDYRIGAAAMVSRIRHNGKPRLAADAHDKGAVFAYRPTSRLKNTQQRPLG